MAERPELIARFQVGLAASGECSAGHEVILVRGQGGKPEQLGDMLKQAFEEHVHRVALTASIYHSIDLSKKVMS
jgi:hypothetical protein